jgi:hypothetical protein
MSEIGTLFIGLVIFGLVFLALREFWCWYWKINERISLLKDQNYLLKKISDKSGGDEIAGVGTIAANPPAKRILGECPKCGSLNDPNESYCQKCSFPLND